MGLMDQLAGKRFNGYLAVRLPHELDDVVTSAVTAYRRAAPAARRDASEAVRPRAAGVLSAYGQRMAAMAVRTGSKEPLRNALVAMGLAQSRLDDPRDNLIVLAAVNHAADSVAGSVDEGALAALIDELADVLPAAAAATFRGFAARPAPAKSLPAMGLRGWGAREDFRYVPGPTTPARA